MKNTYVAVLLLVILGGLAFWYWNSTKDSSESLITQENAVLLQDQQPGTETTVTYAKLAQPGYVVVYSTDANGTMSILGSSDLLSAGQHRNVVVRHRGGSMSSGSLSAAIVVDDGDGQFSEESDTTSVAEDDAEVSADAVLDTNLTDEELAELLDDAGYDLAEAPAEESPAPAEEEDIEETPEVEAVVEEDASATVEAAPEEEPAQ